MRNVRCTSLGHKINIIIPIYFPFSPDKRSQLVASITKISLEITKKNNISESDPNFEISRAIITFLDLHYE